MINSRIKISSVVQNQFPDFVRENYPLLLEFIEQYYSAVDSQGSTLDILQNIDQYVKVDFLTNLIESTTLTEDVSFFDDTINVSSTSGFPNTYGLIQIGNEIITYKEKTETSFLNCVRGFSGVNSLKKVNSQDTLNFVSTNAEDHSATTDGVSTKVTNLSILFLKEFLVKIKKQILPGFEGRNLYENLNDNLFLKQAKNFYESKGSEESFKILFRALYGEEITVIRPSDLLIRSSSAGYRIVRDLVIESISGNPVNLLNQTVYQDQSDISGAAFGSVNSVERIVRDGREYFILSLDYDFDKDINVRGSLSGDFTIHPSTYSVGSVTSGETIITVDSTIGFPDSGTLIAVIDEFTQITISYTSKNYNQFLGCSGITEDLVDGKFLRYSDNAYGFSRIDQTERITFRVTGVLSDIQLPNTKYFSEGQEIKIKSLGGSSKDIRSNNWLFNCSPEYRISTIDLQSLSNKIYNVSTIDDNIFSIGDSVSIKQNNQLTINAKVSQIIDRKKLSIISEELIDTSKSIFILRKISKIKSNNSEISGQISNVQNVYLENKKVPSSIYIASNSLPSYENLELNPSDRSKSFTIPVGISTNVISIQNHGFYSGDSISYIPTNSENPLTNLTGTFYVKKLTDNEISLSKGKRNLFDEKYVDLFGNGLLEKLELYKFAGKKLLPQKIVRKISNPTNILEERKETSPGSTGILVNGVEILNYKSRDSLFYGEIEEIEVISGGKNYSVNSAPEINITDSSGSGATAYCCVEGSISRVDIVDPGFGYLEKPYVNITGGNGSGAKIDLNSTAIEHISNFASNLQSGNTIVFSTDHKFSTGERVIYLTNGQTSISGISDNAYYYVSVVSNLVLKLHNTFQDSVQQINAISFTAPGAGTHSLKSTEKKFTIGSVNVINGGSGYSNRKIVVDSFGINTISNLIQFKNHGFESGDIVVYTTSTSEISGLQNNEKYFIIKFDDDSFALSNISPLGTSKDFDYQTRQTVDLNSSPSGDHTFKYEDIQVSIGGKISNEQYKAEVVPVVRGEIKRVFVKNGGSSYGSQEILNYHRQPNIELSAGSGAEVRPIIQNGIIKQIIIENGGSGYTYSPDISIISESGNGAVLSPIVSNGALIEVKVISGGLNYKTIDTSISIVSPQIGASFEVRLKEWKVNTFSRLTGSNSIGEDDGILDVSLSQNGLRYGHIYAPRYLRKSTFGIDFVNGQRQYVPDLSLNSSGEEVDSTIHSPIIGWAYDGNPIYGPYGYDTPNGGSIRQMISGYELILDSDRPSGFPQEGFFINDYKYTGNGDLDKYNGRFCITPEYPNGVYAYFSTFNTIISNDGLFVGYKAPAFPYFIGSHYKSKLIEFNFDLLSNQDKFNPTDLNLLRNAYPYNFQKENTNYPYLVNSNKIKNQLSKINYTKKSKLDSIDVIFSGEDYKMFDLVNVDSSNSGGSGAFGEVSLLNGKSVSNLNTVSTFINNVEFYSNSPGEYVGVTENYTLNDKDIVYFEDISRPIIRSDANYEISVNDKKTFTLKGDISSPASTGIVTYFNVYGSLNGITSDDVFSIGDERVKVLNIDKKSYRIRVLRNYDGSVGSAHTDSTKLTEVPRKFSIFPGIKTDFNYQVYNKIYINPQESLGLSVGGQTITLSNPGIGISEIFVPENSIYYPNHGFETGDKVSYNSEGNQPIPPYTSGDILYVGKVSSDFFEISSSPIGIGSQGRFVIAGTTTNNTKITGSGTGTYHSFKKIPKDSLTAAAIRNITTVSTASSHGMLDNDYISLEVSPGITTTITLSFPEYAGQSAVVSEIKQFNVLSSIDQTTNTITLTDHGFVQGDKLLCTRSSDSFTTAYYCVYVSKDKFKLSFNQYGATLDIPEVATVENLGTSQVLIAKINPPITAYKGQKLRFDLSSSTLSYFNGSTTSPAFTFSFYTDSDFRNEFYSSKVSSIPEVTRNGIIGVSNDAYVELNITDNIPKTLYYKLVPVEDSNLPEKYLKFNIDKTVKDFYKISTRDSYYRNRYKIFNVTPNTFSFSPDKNIESLSYTSANSSINYVTNSTNTLGPIRKVKTYGGNSYNNLPYVDFINSNIGKNALLEARSKSIGEIGNVEIRDIGFDYPCDLTLAPTANLPQIMKIDPLSILDQIKILDNGLDYTTSPDLILIDSKTNNIIDDVIVNYTLGDSLVTIVKNTNGFNNITPRIVPINNSNLIGITSFFYDSNSKDVQVFLSSTFSSSEDFPFALGDKIFIENSNIVPGSEGKGYNSENYGYELFEITNVFENIGGTGYITYNLSSYLSGNEFPGDFDPDSSLAGVVPEKYLPKFEIILTNNEFFVGETVITNSARGKVLRYDSNNQTLIVSSENDFVLGEILLGNSSGTQGNIETLINESSYYKVSASSIVKKGWIDEIGYLNSNLQRIADNDYYQDFSYSINSSVDFSKWESAVSSLNHIAGFKKFSDLNIESFPNTDSQNPDTSIPQDPNSPETNPDGGVTLPTQAISILSADVDEDDISVSSTFSFISDIDTGCVSDFDFVTERSVLVQGKLLSKEIEFKSTSVSNFIECVSNRVLTIDDVSDQFDEGQNGFELKYNGFEIFKRDFDGSDPNVVDVSSDFINIPNNFFVTGEEIEYVSTTPIEISSTNIPGIGVTDKLPPSLYVIKNNDLGIKVAASASNALANVPVPLNITSVGSGSDHKFISKNTNQKTIISIDGIIQSPVSITNITTTSALNIGIADTVLSFVDGSSFFNGDLIKIDDEIIKIRILSYNGNINNAAVERGWMGTSEASHTLGSTITKVSGNYNIVENRIYFYESPYGELYNSDFTGISLNSKFAGRVFLRSGVTGSSDESYSKNYIFDDISENFDGTSSQFRLTQLNSNVDIGSEDGDNPIILIRNVLQSPPSPGGEFAGNYNLINNNGITTVSFTGTGANEIEDYDVNRFGLPVGGVLVSTASTEGLGYQPLVSAGGTAIVSIAGTIQSVDIQNSGSGYRNSQIVNISVASTSAGNYEVVNIGTATLSNGAISSVNITNGGSGYSQSAPPILIIDSPLPYSNIPLIYSSSSPIAGVGTGAEIEITVGSGTSVIDYKIVNYGYGYKEGEILTIPTLGNSGLQKDLSVSFSEFQIEVLNTYQDNFSGWYIGGISVFDQIDSKFNGIRTKFALKISQENYSIEKQKTSNIEIASTLLVIVNDVLQQPNIDYTFDGGANIEFTIPPNEGDSCIILFYNGTTGIDTKNVEVSETIKLGDTITLNSPNNIQLEQDSRVVSSILSSKTIETNPYTGRGISLDTKFERPISWCKQREDLIINGNLISKNRESYEPLINPTSNIIQPISNSSTEIFVDNLNISFNPRNENSPLNYNNSIKITSNYPSTPCIAEATVNGSSVSSISIVSGGSGYTVAPLVSITKSNSGVSAFATATIDSSGSVISISVDNPFFNSGYDANNPPTVLVDPPTPKQEVIENVEYEGDFGIITGISQTNVGVPTGLIFDLYIPEDSYLRDSDIVENSLNQSVSGIDTGYYFVVKHSNIGNGVISLDNAGNIVGSGTEFLDNVYQVISVSDPSSAITEDVFGETSPQLVRKVTVSIDSYSGISGFGSGQFFGEFSWGKISTITNNVNRRKNPKSFEWYNNGISGISSSASLTRLNPLKFRDYTV